MWCKFPRKEVSRLKAHVRREHNIYPGWWKTGKHDILKAVGVKNVNKRGWGLPGVDLVRCAKPNLFLIIYIGLVNHVITWLRRILAQYGRLELFIDILWSIPAYNSIAKQFKSDSEIS